MTSIMIACVCTNILHIYKPERSVSVANPQTFRKNNYCTVLIEDYIRTLLISTDTYNYSVFSITIVPLYIEDYIRTLLIGTGTYNYSVFSVTTVPLYIEDYIRTLLIGTDTYNYSVFSITTVPLYIEDYIRTSLVSVMIHICLFIEDTFSRFSSI